MLHHGFQHVYHLEGGIINYAHRPVQEEQLDNVFIGKNFVFDDRLGERISDDVIAVCHQCGNPCDTHTNCINSACHLLFIQCPACAENMAGAAVKPAIPSFSFRKKNKGKRKGIHKEHNIFNKSRRRLRPMN